jgi:hypothetical protein
MGNRTVIAHTACEDAIDIARAARLLPLLLLLELLLELLLLLIVLLLLLLLLLLP